MRVGVKAAQKLIAGLRVCAYGSLFVQAFSRLEKQKKKEVPHAPLHKRLQTSALAAKAAPVHTPGKSGCAWGVSWGAAPGPPLAALSSHA